MTEPGGGLFLALMPRAKFQPRAWGDGSGVSLDG